MVGSNFVLDYAGLLFCSGWNYLFGALACYVFGASVGSCDLPCLFYGFIYVWYVGFWVCFVCDCDFTMMRLVEYGLMITVWLLVWCVIGCCCLLFWVLFIWLYVRGCDGLLFMLFVWDCILVTCMVYLLVCLVFWCFIWCRGWVVCVNSVECVWYLTFACWLCLVCWVAYLKLG